MCILRLGLALCLMILVNKVYEKRPHKSMQYVYVIVRCRVYLWRAVRNCVCFGVVCPPLSLILCSVFFFLLSPHQAKEVRVLYGKAAQNLSILLGGPLKHMTYEEVKRAVLRCDEQVLSDTLTESLIQYCPTPDQLKKLENFRDQYDELAEAEQFAITVSYRDNIAICYNRRRNALKSG